MMSSMGMSARSCATSTETVVRPTGVRRSSVSSSILMATAVLESAVAKAKTMTRCIDQSSQWPSVRKTKKDVRICSVVAAIAVL
jgi:hypothetical protein